jgi:hypothetical protein
MSARVISCSTRVAYHKLLLNLAKAVQTGLEFDVVVC